MSGLLTSCKCTECVLPSLIHPHTDSWIACSSAFPCAALCPVCCSMLCISCHSVRKYILMSSASMSLQTFFSLQYLCCPVSCLWGFACKLFLSVFCPIRVMFYISVVSISLSFLFGHVVMVVGTQMHVSNLLNGVTSFSLLCSFNACVLVHSVSILSISLHLEDCWCCAFQSVVMTASHDRLPVWVFASIILLCAERAPCQYKHKNRGVVNHDGWWPSLSFEFWFWCWPISWIFPHSVSPISKIRFYSFVYILACCRGDLCATFHVTVISNSRPFCTHLTVLRLNLTLSV